MAYRPTQSVAFPYHATLDGNPVLNSDMGKTESDFDTVNTWQAAWCYKDEPGNMRQASTPMKDYCGRVVDHKTYFSSQKAAKHAVLVSRGDFA